jgi:hypothetical protein
VTKGETTHLLDFSFDLIAEGSRKALHDLRVVAVLDAVEREESRGGRPREVGVEGR